MESDYIAASSPASLKRSKRRRPSTRHSFPVYRFRTDSLTQAISVAISCGLLQAATVYEKCNLLSTDMAASVLLITIDVEGDNAWQHSEQVQTKNARFLPRFQDLCERYGLRPTYLVNYEMAVDPFFIKFGRDVILRNVGEIGMHLHAWNSPPEYSLSDNDASFQPYLTEYPHDVMDAKIAFMTELLERTFEVKVTSHRGGRWSFDERYARLLVKYGYTVDCSVTPGISWRSNSGSPDRTGGPDYLKFPTTAYFVDPHDISRPGASPLLEIPMTIQRSRLHKILPSCYNWRLVGPVAHRLIPPITWFRPLGPRIHSMYRALKAAHTCVPTHLEFMQHSSEFMPGGSPYFPDKAAVDLLFDNLQMLFECAAESLRGATLREYRASFSTPHSEMSPS